MGKLLLVREVAQLLVSPPAPTAALVVCVDQSSTIGRSHPPLAMTSALPSSPPRSLHALHAQRRAKALPVVGGRRACAAWMSRLMSPCPRSAVAMSERSPTCCVSAPATSRASAESPCSSDSSCARGWFLTTSISALFESCDRQVGERAHHARLAPARRRPPRAIASIERRAALGRASAARSPRSTRQATRCGGLLLLHARLLARALPQWIRMLDARWRPISCLCSSLADTLAHARLHSAPAPCCVAVVVLGRLDQHLGGPRDGLSLSS